MSESVKVIARCRPFNQRETDGKYESILEIDESTGTVVSRNVNAPNEPPKTFTFDAVFSPNSKQVDLYNQTARSIVDAVLSGFNGTIFCYGQTGTGKTFTMVGDRNVSELRGIIPNSIDHIFEYIAQAGATTKFLVRVSYLEIYNEEVRDLLHAKAQRLELKERPDTGVYVKDLSSFVVKSAEEMDKLMTDGNKNRSVAFTQMNATSSRSHSIFTITVEASVAGEDGKEHIRVGKLNLVDLAGSERQSKTGATGDRLKEATKINLSLSALGNVISALVDGKSSHIPYRDSKLTRLLQDSLGGNAKTMMVATLSPASFNYEENISTLRYASRAKNIKNKPKINEDPKDAMLREFQDEIVRLKKQLEEEGGFTEVDTNESDNPQAKAQLRLPSENHLNDMKEQVEKEKLSIINSKGMIEEEKKRILAELEVRAEEIDKERQIKSDLSDKLAQMEAKLLFGGENILDKAQEQQEELERQAAELEERRRKEEKLKYELEKKQEENMQIEDHYSSLQEEAAKKTKKLKALWNTLMQHKAEVVDLQQEYSREREDLLETIRGLQRELKLRTFIVDSFIPQEEQALIESCAVYEDLSEKWRIAHIAHAGNNMKRAKQQQQEPILSIMEGWDPPSFFLSYNVSVDTNRESIVHRKSVDYLRKNTMKKAEIPKQKKPIPNPYRYA